MDKLTHKKKSVVGMVHVQALPGAPRHRLPIGDIGRMAAEDAVQLEQAGFDAVLVENMHDVPYLNRRAEPETIAAMTAVVGSVRTAVKIPVGVQILAGANRAALAVALATGARFIRAEGFVFAHIADEGLMQSDAGDLLRYRKSIAAEDILIFADIKKKHSSHAITADVDLAETARAAEFFGADAVIVTGDATGRPTRLDDLQSAASATQLPVLVGSGTDPDRLREQWHTADGFIVGSWLKREGHWNEPIDPVRLKRFMKAVHEMRLTVAPPQAPPPTEIF